jgi:hypothetical protein
MTVVPFPKLSDMDKQFLELEKQREKILNQRKLISSLVDFDSLITIPVRQKEKK